MGGFPTGARGRATLNPRSPGAWAICDRCGFRVDHSSLQWQLEWTGNQLQNKRILVCPRCLDQPNEQLRSYAVPADPLPIRDPRPDMSDIGNAPIVVTTTTAAFGPVLDGYGAPILDGYGQPILVARALLLVPADPTRQAVFFVLPPSFGLWINAEGGDAADPNSAGTVFYAPGSSFSAIGLAAQSAMTYFTTVAGLTIVVQTQ